MIRPFESDGVLGVMVYSRLPNTPWICLALIGELNFAFGWYWTPDTNLEPSRKFWQISFLMVQFSYWPRLPKKP